VPETVNKVENYHRFEQVLSSFEQFFPPGRPLSAVNSLLFSLNPAQNCPKPHYNPVGRSRNVSKQWN